MITDAEMAEYREERRRIDLMIRYYFETELPPGRKTYEELSRKFSLSYWRVTHLIQRERRNQKEQREAAERDQLIAQMEEEIDQTESGYI